MSDNLDLWSSVSTTDAKYTKGFTRGGGFKGTATNPTWLARQATKTFGPCGIGWGLRVIDERYVDGADGDVVHVVRVCLWYKWEGETGEIEQYGQTQMVGTRKGGQRYTDEEAPKKSITDAMSKCLSLLGFSADIHLGMWDDSKYVSDRQRSSGESDTDAKPKASDQDKAKAKEMMEACETLQELKETWEGLPSHVREAVAATKDEVKAKLTGDKA